MFSRYKAYFEKETLEKRVFVFVLMATVLVSIILIVTNLVLNNEMETNIKWAISLAVSLIFIEFYTQGKFNTILEHAVFIAFVFVMIPLGYEHGGKNLLLSLSYVFLLCVGINIVFTKWEKYFYTFSIIGVYLTLFISKHLETGGDKIQFFDQMVSIPLTIIAASIMIAVVAKSYRIEHRLLSEKNVELEDANERLQVISTTDYLTEIYNRRTIVSRLKDRIEDINMGGDKILGIYLIDLDNFKPVNDTYGQYIGDAVLKTITLEIQKVIEGENIDVGRYGGDEFLFVFDDYDELKCLHFVEEVQKAIKAIELPHGINVTVSGGYIKYRIDRHRTVEKLLEEADKRLHIAKQSGKDKAIYH